MTEYFVIRGGDPNHINKEHDMIRIAASLVRCILVFALTLLGLGSSIVLAAKGGSLYLRTAQAWPGAALIVLALAVELAVLFFFTSQLDKCS